MNIIPALKQSVSLAARSSLSDSGIPAYGSASPVACRIDYKTSIVRTADGQELTSTAKIVLGPSATVNLTDRVTMPDSTYREILDLKLLYDLKGVLIGKEVSV
jgi:hypothetical protein